MTFLLLMSWRNLRQQRAMSTSMMKIALTFTIIAGVTILRTIPALGTEPVYFGSVTAKYPETITTTATNMKILEGGKDSVSCAKVELTGKLTETSTTLSQAASYSGCTALIGGTESSATVTPGSCKYEFSKITEGSETEGEVNELTGQESIGSSGCGPIKIEVPEAKCTFEVSSQGPITGTTIKPDGGKEVEITSEIANASVVSKGCVRMCETLTPYHFWIIVHGVYKLYVEFSKLRFQFRQGGTPTALLVFNESEILIVEIYNPAKLWPMILDHGEVINPKWKVSEVFGEPGEICAKLFYGPKTGCNIHVLAPAEKLSKGAIKLFGIVFSRGELAVETK